MHCLPTSATTPIYFLTPLIATSLCYVFRVLWYIFRVLTYQSDVTATHFKLIPVESQTFHIITYCRISIVSSQKLLDTLRISYASQLHLFEFCQIVTFRLERSSLF